MTSPSISEVGDGVDELFALRETELAFHRRRLRFALARSVFSSAGPDPGSMLLLRHLQSLPLEGGERVLDIGCGHGTLGLTLQALDPERHVVSVDRDALALRYTARNLGLNDLDADRHRIVGSVGYDGLDPVRDGPFDLIVSNLPGKAGEPVLDQLLGEAKRWCRPGGLLAVVVVKPLGPFVTRSMAAHGHAAVLAKGNNQYDVIIATVGSEPGEQEAEPSPPPPPALGGALASGAYDRDQDHFRSAGLSWEATTVVGLDEFDSLGYGTRLLRTALQGTHRGASLIIEPGQGHRAVIAAKAGYPPAAVLSRDALALRATSRMLVDNGFDEPSTVHGIGVDDVWPHVDEIPGVVVLNAPDKLHAPWFVDQVQRLLRAFVEAGRDRPRDLVVIGRAGPLGRLEVDVLRRHKGHLAHKRTERGFRALRFQLTAR